MTAADAARSQTRSSARPGPYGAGVLPRLVFRLAPSAEPIREPRTKLGGDPVWLAEPTWPVERDTGVLMRFIGQFVVPDEQQFRMAYLFIADEDGSAETSDPVGGRNALLVQPGGRVPPEVDVVASGTGPTLSRRGASWDDRVPTEIDVELVVPESAESAELESWIDYDEAFRAGTYGNIPEGINYPRSYVGDRPLYGASGLMLVGAEWDFFFQFEGGESWDGEPFVLNFGGGVGHAFLSGDNLEGRFFWRM